MANLSGAPPGPKSETPDPAATGSSVTIPYLADGRDRHTSDQAFAQSDAPVVLRYGGALDAMTPGSVGVDRRLRCGILYLRDRATAGLRVAGWEASLLLRSIESLATAHAFAPMPASELIELHRVMIRVMTAAQSLDARGPRAEVAS